MENFYVKYERPVYVQTFEQLFKTVESEFCGIFSLYKIDFEHEFLIYRAYTYLNNDQIWHLFRVLKVYHIECDIFAYKHQLRAKFWLKR